jgi:hypothetical protein
MKRVLVTVRICTYIALLTMTSACTKKVDWSEDVQLADGRVVTLTRHQEFGGPHELFQPPTESVGWLEFKHPDTGQKIRWDFTRDLRPVALLIEHNTTRLLVVLEYGAIFRRHCPSPPFLLYQYGEHGWKEEPIENLRGQKIRQNVISTPFDAEEIMKTDNLHLNVQHTMQRANGYTHGHRIDFGKLTTQTFEMRGCSPPFNYLLENQETMQ